MIKLIILLLIDYIPDQYPLRLVGGSSPAQGRLEVFYNGQWGSVCDDYFGGVEARVSVDILQLYGSNIMKYQVC